MLCGSSIHPFPLFEGRLLDLLAPREDRRLAAVVDIRRSHVLQGFVQPAVVVVLDEAPDGAFELPGAVVVLLEFPRSS